MTDLLAIADSGPWPAHDGWPRYPRDTPAMVAIHEAGHLIVALALQAHGGLDSGRELVAVSSGHEGALHHVRDGHRVQPPAEVRTQPYAPWVDADDKARRMVLDRVAVYLAGRAAESIAAGFELRGWPRALLDTDDGRSAVLFSSLCWPERIDGPLQAGWLLARHTLERERAWLQRVAAVIETTGQCSGQDALALRSCDSRPVTGLDGECRSWATQ